MNQSLVRWTFAAGAIALGLAFGACSSSSSTDTGGSAGADAAAARADAAAGNADAGSGPCTAGFAGCTTFMDLTAGAANRTVTFTSFEYTPKCIRIKSGQQVTFMGDFGMHPLFHQCGPAQGITNSAPAGPLTFTATGLYGYFCLNHGLPAGTGMAGAIEVVP